MPSKNATSSEGDIRRAIIEADLMDCMIALPGQLFYTTQIPVCLWFLAKNKAGDRYRDLHGETLFIDARKLGVLIDRTHRELTEEDLDGIISTYHAWRGIPPLYEVGRGLGGGEYADVPGFCKRATLDEIAGHGYVLTSGRYVGAADTLDDGEPFEDKMRRLTATLERKWPRVNAWML
jgi:type I restriction enzyme M protein